MDTQCQWVQDSPFGSLLIETGPKGVRSVTFRAGARTRSAVCKDCAKIQAAFDRYFDGGANALASLHVDLSNARTAFNRKVLETLHDAIPAGSTTTYAALAEASGRPGAARAVGSAMANNPVPIIVPCHRVLASDGTLGGYGGGLDMKRGLLTIEGVNGARLEAKPHKKPTRRAER